MYLPYSIFFQILILDLLATCPRIVQSSKLQAKEGPKEEVSQNTPKNYKALP